MEYVIWIQDRPAIGGWTQEEAERIARDLTDEGYTAVAIPDDENLTFGTAFNVPITVKS